MVTGTYLLLLPLGWALIRGWVFIRTNTVESVLLSRFGPRYFLLKSSGQGQPRVSAKCELRYESLKSKFSLILFAFN